MMNKSWDWLEVLRYGVIDADGDSFTEGCFGEVTGQLVALSWGFDPRVPLGQGTLHDSPDSLWVKIPEPAIRWLADHHPGPIEACLGGRVEIRTDRRITKATISEVALVANGLKTSYNLAPA